MIAFFTGTFDPPTIGHLNIIERASNLFDKVVVLMLINPDKKTKYTVNQRLEMLKLLTSNFDNVTFDFSDKYAVDYVKSHGGGVLLRGLRNVNDFAYEADMAKYNVEHGVDTVFMMAADSLKSVSSTAAKENGKNNLLPQKIADFIKTLS